MLQFLPRSHVVKISDEELEFLTGCRDIQQALPRLFVGSVQLVIYTCGRQGAYAFTPNAQAFAPCAPVKAVDTTGAGDAFIGSFLWQLARDGVDPASLPKLRKTRLEQYLAFSNRCCGFSVQKHGALDSYPTLEQMEQAE